jgi:hypothetical protein
MPIFDMYGGRPDLYTADETDRLNNPEKYNYTQAQYDALVARIESRVKSRQAVDQRGREAVLTSYANFGTGGTNPGFSLAGRSGHTSGGLAGNAGTAEYAGTAQYAEGGRVEQEGIGLLFERANTPAPMDPILEHHYRNLAEGKAVNNDDGSVSTVYTTQVDIDGTPTLIPKIWDGQVLSDEAALQRSLASGKTWPTAATHEDLRQYDIELHKEMAPMTAEAAQKVLAGGDDSQQYAEGGMVQNVQYMQLGGMASPYADPISKPQMMGQQPFELPMSGVGGLFQDMNRNRNQMEQNRNQMGMMQAQMGGAPLEVYSNYLNNVYTAPQAESSQAQVAEFIDMVDRAERAHFGAEESFGYGGGAYQQGLMSQYQNLPAPTNMMDNQQYRGGPSGLEQSAGFSQLPQMSSGLPQVY